MKQIFTSILLWAVACLAGYAQAKATFDKTVHDFGVVLWKHPATAKFQIKNDGDKPLVISNVTSSCGCTVVDWTQAPIAPGATGEVSAIFDAKALGHFYREIGVYCNASFRPIYLTLQGEVSADPKNYTLTHPYGIGNVRLNKDAIEFDDANKGDKPMAEILIANTSSEAYTPVDNSEVIWSGEHRTTDSRYNVVGIGDEMARELAKAGISVIHDRNMYDYPQYSGAYDRSLESIQQYLKEYPSIRFVLDVHRDAIEDSSGNEYKVVSAIEGQGTAAQLSLVMGSDAGGLAHPRWMENLKLAVALQEHLLTQHPTLMRPMLLRGSRYNQHTTTGSLLVEVGAAGNSPDEAILAARLFARSMAEVLTAPQ